MERTGRADAFRIGDEVRLKHRHTGAQKARIVHFYDDIPGGVRLSSKLAGFESWNVQDILPTGNPTKVYG
jgi:hypothetical protein